MELREPPEALAVTVGVSVPKLLPVVTASVVEPSRVNLGVKLLSTHRMFIQVPTSMM